jgi:hypothetical protein
LVLGDNSVLGKGAIDRDHQAKKCRDKSPHRCPHFKAFEPGPKRNGMRPPSSSALAAAIDRSVLPTARQAEIERN